MQKLYNYVVSDYVSDAGYNKLVARFNKSKAVFITLELLLKYCNFN